LPPISFLRMRLVPAALHSAALFPPGAEAQVVLRERVELPARAAQTAPGPVAASSTAAMQQEARCESGSAADAVAASDCTTGFDSDRSPGRALLHPDL
jgi:hypothetical protein